MSHVAQFDASLSREVGIQTQYLDREGNFVDNALAGRLPLAPQFEVLEHVISAIAVSVVHAFVTVKVAAQSFRHNGSVLKYFFTSTQVETDVPRGMHVPVLVDRAPFTSSISTLFGAEFLPLIVARVLAVLGFTKATFLCFTAELALKSRCRSFVHEHSLARRTVLVKEID